MALKKTFICPYCFDKINMADIEFRCSYNRCKNTFEDMPMTIYLDGNPQMPYTGKKTFRPKVPVRKIPMSAKCPECHKDTNKIICPSCHNELPESTLTGKDRIISIVGARASGKSHFVGVLIEELGRVAYDFGGSIEGFADSYKRWEDNFYNSLYKDGVKLELTQSSTTNVDNGVYMPYIFKLKLKKKKRFGTENECFTFVFFDTAGEDLDSEDVMNTVNKYICKSSGIIFLLDPMQISMVSKQLDNEFAKRAAGIELNSATRPDDIITRVSKLIRNDKGLRETDSIDIPVAAVFSKFDAIESLVPKDFTVHKPSPHCSNQYFDLSDWHNVNSEIEALLKEWDARMFISNLKMNYKKFSFFSVSSLGLNNNPVNDRIQRPRPHRVEDPLLWLFNEFGLIKGK